MSVTFVTYHPNLCWPKPQCHRPCDSAEAASWIAIENTGRGRCVLLLTGVPDRLTPHMAVSKKPWAIRVNQLQRGFGGVSEAVKEFCNRLNNRHSKEWAAKARLRPVVIVNDADYFFAEGYCGEFTTECTEHAIAQVKQLQNTLDRYDGHLIVMAAIVEETDCWSRSVTDKSWLCSSVSDLFDPKRYLAPEERWWHSASEEPPSNFAHGPLEGSQKQIAPTLYADGNDDYRRVRQRAESKGIWVRKLNSRLIQVWFKTEVEFKTAKKQMWDRSGSS